MERSKNNDLELAKYIWSILKSNLPVLMSWGVDFNNITVINGGLQFHVQGFILSGNVAVVYNEGTDYFDVTLHKDKSPEEVQVYTNVALDELVDLIDSKVEKTNGYEKRISDTYNMIRY